jgi:hypothetical protein
MGPSGCITKFKLTFVSSVYTHRVKNNKNKHDSDDRMITNRTANKTRTCTMYHCPQSAPEDFYPDINISRSPDGGNIRVTSRVTQLFRTCTTCRRAFGDRLSESFVVPSGQQGSTYSSSWRVSIMSLDEWSCREPKWPIGYWGGAKLLAHISKFAIM